MSDISTGKKQEFTPEQLRIAFILAGYKSDRSKWDEVAATEVENLRTMSLFYCPPMIELRGRGKTIVKRCKKVLQLKVQRRTFNTLSRRRAVTLDGILHVDSVLTAIASQSDADLRKATLAKRGSRKACVVLRENDVVPSHLWVNRPLLVEFRDQFNIGRRELAAIMFDDEDRDAFFYKIEEGEIVTKKTKPVEYDFRITGYSAACLFFAMETIFDALSARIEDRKYELPSFGFLFQASSTAGLATYNRTRPLPIENGNIIQPLSPEFRQEIKQRVAAFAKEAPKEIKKRKR